MEDWKGIRGILMSKANKIHLSSIQLISIIICSLLANLIDDDASPAAVLNVEMFQNGIARIYAHRVVTYT